MKTLLLVVVTFVLMMQTFHKEPTKVYDTVKITYFKKPNPKYMVVTYVDSKGVSRTLKSRRCGSYKSIKVGQAYKADVSSDTACGFVNSIR